MTAKDIIKKYIKFFEDRGHEGILNSPLVPENDPTTLFTSSGMQPLIPYLLGEPHPQGTKLVNVQNCFRAVDIDEVGDNRHTTFFRMLGNWSLGDYFKSEEIPWLWEFLTVELRLPKEKLYITVFTGDKNIEFDSESEIIWKKIFARENLEPKIFKDTTNWWSRSGPSDKMPSGEPGGPDTEVYFRFDDIEHKKECFGDDPTKCECGRFLEIANSVFMQYQKQDNGSLKILPKPNVDFGGGLERLLAAIENKSDVFQTSLFLPIIEAIEKYSSKNYNDNQKELRILADHLRASIYLLNAKVIPSNKERGYILRRLIRRAVDNLGNTEQNALEKIIEAIVLECSKTDEELKTNYEEIKNSILEEAGNYTRALEAGKILIEKELKKLGEKEENELKGVNEIPAEIAFKATASFGLGPTQLESLGYAFDKQEFAKIMEEHQNISRAGATRKFKGGLADTSEQTIMGHTATHLLHQALRDVFGNQLHQTGSNITSERIRFDFNHDSMLTKDEIAKVENIVNEKIKENLPVHFEMMPLGKAKEIGAIGLFDEKYEKDVKIYFIGPSAKSGQDAYSKEFCGGPHVNFTSMLKRFKIDSVGNLGANQKRIYAKVGD